MRVIRENSQWGKIEKNYMMKEVTSFKIGGPVDFFIEPENVDQLKSCILDLEKEKYPWMIMGLGSNMVVSDKGIRGAVIRLGKNFSKISIEGLEVRAQAGASLKSVAEYARDHGLGGLEFAHGIPGSIGGAMTMNAGAYDGEMKDVVQSVLVMDKEGKIHELSNEEMHFVYRNSRVQEDGFIVLETIFRLEVKDKEAITEKMDDLWNRRLSKQPLEYPSAGSTFKRPPGYYAGQLIDQAGLRGLKHGGAQVSQKHCGFVINADNATCQDVVELIKIVQESVLLEHGVNLETEVKVIGE